jgi:RimJ/RimL family protein N-acetyltransferase
MVTIVTERLELREFNQADWVLVHEYASDPEVTRYVGWGPNSLEDTKNFILRAMSYQREEPRRKFDLAITLKEGNTLIGGCSIRVSDPDNREGSIGYLLRRQFWGRGYATEASQALLDFGFGKLGMHRISAWCDVENTASSRVLERIGMQREGRLREFRLIRGEWHDSYLYAVLDREWKSKDQTEEQRHEKQ